MSALPPGCEAGHRALSALDRALSRKPERDDDALSDATADLTAFRDAIIAEQRCGGIRTADERRHLAHLNSVLSVVLGVHFPLGETPWEELQRARGWLADLVKGPDGASRSPDTASPQEEPV